MIPSIKHRLASLLFLALAVTSALAQEKVTADDILQRHLDSIGTSTVRTAAKTRVVEAKASYRVLLGGTPVQYDGKAVMVSGGNKLHMLLKINAPQYTGERFIRDGDKTSVEATYANKTRSELGTLLQADDTPIREGLIGGVLNTAWPLFDLGSHKGKIQYQGLKRIDGTDLHVVRYQPGKNTGFEITLYFDPQTLRHVRTVYLEDRATGITTSPFRDTVAPPSRRNPERLNGPDARSARLGPTWWRIEEQFGNFMTIDGLTLPTHYDLRFQRQLPSRSIQTIEWDVTTTRVLSNVSVDSRNFQIH
ncbi:MAG: hypothetical protein LAO23_13515 [Acidobacteriia bacterium]|nr:hypothetical protein [Terriglobia bacterium]